MKISTLATFFAAAALTTGLVAAPDTARAEDPADGMIAFCGSLLHPTTFTNVGGQTEIVGTVPLLEGSITDYMFVIEHSDGAGFMDITLLIQDGINTNVVVSTAFAVVFPMKISELAGKNLVVYKTENQKVICKGAIEPLV